MTPALRERVAGAPTWARAAALAGVVSALSAFAYAPLFGGGMILTGDTLHAFRILEIHRCLDDGQIPCRWAAELGNGYGAPLFNYYPPLPYYAGDLLHRLGLSYLATVDALYIIGLAGAGLSMFVLGRRLWGDLGGAVSALAYVYAPYLALDVYMRGALAELWALALLPALLWSILELVSAPRPRAVPLVALFLALLLLAHNLVAVIAAPAVALWAAALLALPGRDGLRPALLGAGAALWGVGLAAFFTLPVLLEGDLVRLDDLTRGPFDYRNHFASAGDLFLLRTNDYSFLLGAREDTPVQIGWFHWAMAGVSLPAGALLWRTGRRTAAAAVAVLAAAFAIGVFMAMGISRSVWEAFDALRFLQFPWRYLGLVSLAAAGLAGAWLAVLRERPLAARFAVAAALGGIFVATGAYFHQPLYRCEANAPGPVFCPGSDEEYFSDRYVRQHREGSVRDYLPVAVEEVPQPPAAQARAVSGTARIAEAERSSDSLRLHIEAETAATIEAAVFDFPNWRVRIDGGGAPHEASAPHGLITFEVAPGGHEVELALEDTAARRAANALSLASWAALLIGVPAFAAAGRLRP